MCQSQSPRHPSINSLGFSESYHSHDKPVFTTTMSSYHDDIPEGLPTRGFDRSRQSSTCSERSCEGMSTDEMRGLWRVMLELQERYGCYNSTRVSLAVKAGDEAGLLMPSRFIIDTLNHSLVDLPEEGWEMLENSYIRHDHETPPPKQKRRLWHRRS